MSRDEYGSWIPCTFFYVRNQNSTMIRTSLDIIIEWAGGLESGWKLRYMITDDDAAEQKAVRESFTHPDSGTIPICKVSHFLCTRHVKEALLKRTNTHKLVMEAYTYMLEALYRETTEDGCHEKIKKAIDTCNSSGQQVNARYLAETYGERPYMWAYYARANVPLLLQCPTSNPVEGWHSRLKADGAKQQMASSGTLLGGVIAVWHAEEDYLAKAEVTANKFQKSRLPLANGFPDWGFEVLPFTVQGMVEEQFMKAKKALDGGDPAAIAYFQDRVTIPGYGDVDPESQHAIPGLEKSSYADVPFCPCHWYRKWQLPCKHIFLHQLSYATITKDHFRQLVHMWQEDGFEIYEQIQQPFKRETAERIIGMPGPVKVNFAEMINSFWRKIYATHDALQERATPEEYEEGMVILEERMRWSLRIVENCQVGEIAEEDL
ncbi:hypothetical protein F4781DRAFT_438298 [Annulohypoxylon bovei var. microspora]|nr:hypothetical protein F4781DRAFT_438298 [Annulohypoxylon bovei var. microspora]